MDIQNQYNITVRNKFYALQADVVTPSPNATYNNFVTSHVKAAEDIIPLKPKLRKLVPWESNDIDVKRMSSKEKSATKNYNPSLTSIQEFNKARAQLKNTYEEQQVKYIQSKIHLISHAAANKQSALAWKTVNAISGIKSSNKLKAKS